MTKIAKREQPEEQAEVPWWRALARRALRVTAATTVAVGGEKARELSNELLDAADGVAPPQQPSDPPRLAEDPLFVVFTDRMKVVNELGRLSIECMSGYGWSHVMRVPVPAAAKLVEIVKPVLEPKTAWRDRVTDCYGYSQALHDSTDELSRIATRQLAGEIEAADANTLMTKARQDALNAIQFLGERLSRLVWAFDEYVRGAEPSTDGESASEEPPVSDDPFRG